MPDGWKYPVNHQAEQQILGAILTDDKLLLDVSEFIDPQDFHADDHRAIYEIALKLRASGKPSNVITISDAIGRTDKLQISRTDLERIEDSLIEPGRRAAVEYAKQIADQARTRASMKAMVEALGDLSRIGPGESVAEAIDKAESAIFEAGRARKTQGVWLIDAMEQLIDNIQRDQESGKMSRGLSWGLPELDDICGRLIPGRQIFLGGIPGSGKSSLGVQMLLAQDKPTVFYSLEMSDEDHAMRRFTTDRDITAHKLETRQINRVEIERMADRLGEDRKQYKGKGIRLASGRKTIAQIKAHARREKHAHDIGVIAIDHIRIIAKSDRRMMEYEHAAEVTFEGKELAKELDVAVVMLGQLKRPEGQRSDYRPRPSDAYGGGAVEQNVDLMAYIHRPEMFMQMQKPPPERGQEALAKWEAEVHRVEGLAEILTGKRRGGKGYRSRELLFDGPTTTFKSKMEKRETGRSNLSEQDQMDFR